MRPRMTIDQVSAGATAVKPEMEEPVVPDNNSKVLQEMDEAIRREQSQASIKPILDRMEREDAFTRHDSDALMCSSCCMPCYQDDHTPFRKAIPIGRNIVICNECLCGNH